MDTSTEGASESARRAASELRVGLSRLRRLLKEFYDTQELTPSQLSLLSRLSKGGPATASELAAAERVRPQSVAATLGVLDERGLIERRPDPDDGRRQLVSLNPSGQEIIAGGRQAGEEWLSRALQEHYTEAELATVIEAMTLLERLSHP